MECGWLLVVVVVIVWRVEERVLQANERKVLESRRERNMVVMLGFLQAYKVV